MPQSTVSHTGLGVSRASCTCCTDDHDPFIVLTETKFRLYVPVRGAHTRRADVPECKSAGRLERRPALRLASLVRCHLGVHPEVIVRLLLPSPVAHLLCNRQVLRVTLDRLTKGPYRIKRAVEAPAPSYKRKTLGSCSFKVRSLRTPWQQVWKS